MSLKGRNTDKVTNGKNEKEPRDVAYEFIARPNERSVFLLLRLVDSNPNLLVSQRIEYGVITALQSRPKEEFPRLRSEIELRRASSNNEQSS